MSKLSSIFDRLFGGGGRQHQGQLPLPVDGGSEFAFGVTRSGRKSALTEKIDATGARPGDTVAIDEHGDARVVGRKPEIGVDNSASSN